MCEGGGSCFVFRNVKENVIDKVFTPCKLLLFGSVGKPPAQITFMTSGAGGGRA